MFRLLGGRLHPAVGALIGVVVAVFGLGDHRPVLAVVGGVLVVGSLVRGLAALQGRRPTDHR